MAGCRATLIARLACSIRRHARPANSTAFSVSSAAFSAADAFSAATLSATAFSAAAFAAAALSCAAFVAAALSFAAFSAAALSAFVLLKVRQKAGEAGGARGAAAPMLKSKVGKAAGACAVWSHLS